METRDRIRELVREGVDWRRLTDIAGGHGLIPLLYWNVNAACPEQAGLDAIRSQFHHNARRNLSLAQELLRLLKLFQAGGVVAVPFKGLALAASAYGNLALRQAGDLDILVELGNVDAAKEVLLRAGYRAQRRWPAGVRETAGFRSLCVYNHVFVPEAKEPVIELHWAIGPAYLWSSRDPDWLWHEIEYQEIEGVPIPALPPETLLLVLCLHGSKHEWKRLSWICDVAEHIRSYPSIDWKKVFDSAGRLRCRRMLRLGLLLAHDLLGASVPEWVEERVRSDRGAVRVAETTCKRLFGPPSDPDRWSNRGFTTISLTPGKAAYYLKIQDGMVDTLRTGLRLLQLAGHPTAEDRTFLPLPEFLTFVYFALRPLRLAGKYGQGVVKRFFRF